MQKLGLAGGLLKTAAPGYCWITCLLPIMNLVAIQINYSDRNCYKTWLVPHLSRSGLFAFRGLKVAFGLSVQLHHSIFKIYKSIYYAA